MVDLDYNNIRVNDYLYNMENFKEKGLISLLFVIGLALPVTIDAATLYLSPSSGSYNVGQTFQVSVLVSSPGQPVNAYSGTISFTQQNLAVVSLPQTDSIVSFWVQQPNFLNTTGQIIFEGVTFDPGFQGSSGRILTISFRAKAAGSVILSFTKSAVLAHDGKGTDILTSASGAQYNIRVAEVEPSDLPPEPEAELLDTDPPEPFEVVVEDDRFIFETTDKGSGLDRYEIILNEELYDTVSPEDVPPYQCSPPLFPGEYSLEVKAFDKAGNFTSAFTDFEFLASGDITITEIPSRIREGDPLPIRGKTLPELLVKIYIQREGEQPTVAETTANSTGDFMFQYNKALAEGNYLIWAQGTDKRGSLTNPSQKHSLKVGLPPFLRFGKITIDYLATMIALIFLIIVATIIIAYTWYRISLWRKRMRKETEEVSKRVVAAFRNLRKEVGKQIQFLDGKPGLNKDEKQVRDKLKDALNVSEEFITKEIEDVERELE